ncbi:hypothetical protein [uncultured Amphritea sp.]|uniref:hypothetical protein n=1 Tax=uncultured Amphritea sp. TaxID=981605 RepID=UPI0026322795|nr:hypothetical protein [uncultured Amphritea sp.]
MKKSILSISLCTALYGIAVPNSAFAVCPACANVQSYGADVNSETAQATSNVNSASQAISTGFSQLRVTIDDVFGDLGSAIRAMSGNITSEIQRGTVSQQKLMDEFNRQEELRSQAAYILESKRAAEAEYGEENLPVTSCDDFAQAADLRLAKEVTEEELRASLDSFFAEYRAASPVDDWRYHERTLMNLSANEVALNKDVLSPEEVEQAVEWINQVVDPVPVSPISPDRPVNRMSADERLQHSAIQTLNLRLDAAKEAMKEQVLLKAPIVGEEDSIQSTLSSRAYSALDPENLIDLSTGSQALVLRTMLRDTQYGLAIDLENLKLNMRRARMDAVQLAQLSDKYRVFYRQREKHIDGVERVKN